MSQAVAALAAKQHLPSVRPLILPENGGLAGDSRVLVRGTAIRKEILCVA